MQNPTPTEIIQKLESSSEDKSIDFEKELLPLLEVNSQILEQLKNWRPVKSGVLGFLKSKIQIIIRNVVISTLTPSLRKQQKFNQQVLEALKVLHVNQSSSEKQQ